MKSGLIRSEHNMKNKFGVVHKYYIEIIIIPYDDDNLFCQLAYVQFTRLIYVRPLPLAKNTRYLMRIVQTKRDYL